MATVAHKIRAELKHQHNLTSRDVSVRTISAYRTDVDVKTRKVDFKTIEKIAKSFEKSENHSNNETFFHDMVFVDLDGLLISILLVSYDDLRSCIKNIVKDGGSKGYASRSTRETLDMTYNHTKETFYVKCQGKVVLELCCGTDADSVARDVIVSLYKKGLI